MKNKVVAITGASRGIGADTARVFANAGAKVALLARNTPEIEALAEEIGSAALAIQCDVAEYAQVKAAVDRTLTTFGRLDVMISNAGMIQPISLIASSDPQEWARAINVNLTGTYNCTRAVLPGMITQGSGTILNISSGAANSPIEGWTAYCSSKAGAAMLTRGTDLEVRDAGIRVIGLSPGTVATQMQRDIKASGINPVSQMDWSDHVAPDWPARALLWMCGADADEFLGQDISLREDDIHKRVGLTS